ncbi:MAG: hypothetical protein IT576_17120 [Verrucomicrobiales bacterium]|nr:hypothetical protein [Verrucomicrobiales bacterium]
MSCQTLHLHIGSPKTATTALQVHLQKHRIALAGQGLLYPESGVLHSAAWDRPGTPVDNYLAPAHHGFIWWPSSHAGPVCLAETSVWDQLGEELEKTACPDAVVSNEAFWFVPAAEVRARLAGVFKGKIRLICYLRRQDGSAASNYAEFCKMGYFTGSPAAFLDQGQAHGANRVVADTVRSLDYQSWLTPWIEAFGRENVTVRAFEKDRLVQGDIGRDFLSRLIPGKTIGENLPPAGWHNESLDPRSLVAIREFRRSLESSPLAPNAPGWGQHESDFRDRLREAAAAAGWTCCKALVLEPEQAAALLERHASCNAWLQEQWGPVGEGASFFPAALTSVSANLPSLTELPGDQLARFYEKLLLEPLGSDCFRAVGAPDGEAERWRLKCGQLELQLRAAQKHEFSRRNSIIQALRNVEESLTVLEGSRRWRLMHLGSRRRASKSLGRLRDWVGKLRTRLGF